MSDNQVRASASSAASEPPYRYTNKWQRLLGAKPDPKSEEELLAELNAQHCLALTPAGRLTVLTYERDCDWWEPWSRKTFKGWYRNRHVIMDGKLVTLANWWLEHPQRRTAKINHEACAEQRHGRRGWPSSALREEQR